MKDHIDITRRRSGNTYRKILHALIKASEGRSVVYFSGTAILRNFYFDMAKYLTVPVLPSRCIDGAQKTIHFPGGGTVRFEISRNRDKFLGMRFEEVILDD